MGISMVLNSRRKLLCPKLKLITTGSSSKSTTDQTRPLLEWRSTINTWSRWHAIQTVDSLYTIPKSVSCTITIIFISKRPWGNLKWGTSMIWKERLPIGELSTKASIIKYSITMIRSETRSSWNKIFYSKLALTLLQKNRGLRIRKTAIR